MIHFTLSYDSEQQQADLQWWSNKLSKVKYQGPFKLESGGSAAVTFLDYEDVYDTENEEAKRDEELPLGISFAEDVTNYLAALQGSCQNDSLVMIWKKPTYPGPYQSQSEFLTSIRFPSGHLKLQEDRDNIFSWRQREEPGLKLSPNLYYTPLRYNLTLEFRGWNFWNYHWKTGAMIRRADKILSFLTYLCVRTRWDWDQTLFNTNPYYGVPYRSGLRNTWPKLAKRLFQLNGNTAEMALIRIIDMYWSYFDRINKQYKDTQYDYVFNAVQYWIDHNFLPYAPSNSYQNYNYRLEGSEYQNIVEPLQESSIIKELSVCICNNNTNNIVTSVNRLNTRIFNTILDFNKFKTIAASRKMYALMTQGTCGQCAAFRRHVQYFIGDTTWFLYLEPRLHSFVPNLNIDELPKELELRDAFSSNYFAIFDLGYVSFVKYSNSDFGAETIQRYGHTHYVSFQLLWGNWYYYDSYNFGPLTKVQGQPVNIVIEKKLAFAAAVYFRR